MQNILPVLALSPDRVIQIVSGRIQKSAPKGPDAVQSALAGSGFNPEFGDVRMSPHHPTHTDVFQAIHQAVEEERAAGRTPVINVTGGSKLMSIGAFAAAAKTESPAVYVDTPQMRFVLAYDGPPEIHSALGPLMDFNAAMRGLTLELIAIAHGARLGHAEDWQVMLPLSESIRDSFDGWQQCAKDFDRLLRAQASPGKRFPPYPEDVEGWMRLWTLPFSLPSLVGTEAVRTGHVIHDGSHFRLSPGWMLPQLTELLARKPAPVRGKPTPEQRLIWDAFEKEANLLTLRVQAFLNLLFGGSWLEVLTAESLKRQSDILDVRWSVPEFNIKGNPATEHDVLALWHGRLVRVSCKLGGAGDKLPAACSEAAHAARRLGGILSIGVLGVGPGLSYKRRQSLLERAQRDRILVVEAVDLPRNDWFRPGL